MANPTQAINIGPTPQPSTIARVIATHIKRTTPWRTKFSGNEIILLRHNKHTTSVLNLNGSPWVPAAKHQIGYALEKVELSDPHSLDKITTLLNNVWHQLEKQDMPKHINKWKINGPKVHPLHPPKGLPPVPALIKAIRHTLTTPKNYRINYAYTHEGHAIRIYHQNCDLNNFICYNHPKEFHRLNTHTVQYWLTIGPTEDINLHVLANTNNQIASKTLVNLNDPDSLHILGPTITKQLTNPDEIHLTSKLIKRWAKPKIAQTAALLQNLKEQHKTRVQLAARITKIIRPVLPDGETKLEVGGTHGDYRCVVKIHRPGRKTQAIFLDVTGPRQAVRICGDAHPLRPLTCLDRPDASSKIRSKLLDILII